MKDRLLEEYGDDAEYGIDARARKNRFPARRNTDRGTRDLEGQSEKTERGFGADCPNGASDEDGDALDFFVGEGIIEGKGPILKQGKEACVYRCPGKKPQAEGDVAVKAYKDIERRSFQAMSRYLDGRLAEAGISRRDRMHLLSTPVELQGFWVESEFSVLSRLHGAGLPVPRPLARSKTAIAMEFIGEGPEAAPRLRDCRLSPDAGRSCRDEILQAIGRMLSLDVVHGDLSPFNILMRGGRPVIIDFPQAIDARYNSLALDFLERDVRNVCRFFPSPRASPDEEAARIARRFWDDYSRVGLR